MKISTRRFGTIEIQEDQGIRMPQGVIGFPSQRRYIFWEHRKRSPFIWFQAVDDEDLAFVLIDPLLFKPDYEILVSPEDREALQLEDSCEGVKTLVIVNIVPGDPIKITANLLDPVLVNTKKDWPNKLSYTDLHTRPGFPSPRWTNRNSTPKAESLDEKGLSRSPVLDFSYWSIFSNPD